MSAIAISNLGKAYKQYSSRWARLVEWIAPFLGKRHQLRWVLKDISFSVQPGEALGIIGINGAGKSTLLKMITGTVQPTEGAVKITGKVAALLELGMGFHPDFTGRQNVYMAGQLLGYSSGEIRSLMPEIEAFAEIGDYLDQPVRIYSSGMQVRLAFSVATVRRPDVLIVDEALSVGDAYFQHKSFNRIREYRAQGTTLLIVSHDKSAIQGICDHAILLSEGVIINQGEPEGVMDFYNAMLASNQNQEIRQEIGDSGKLKTISGTGDVNITDVFLINDAGLVVDTISVGQKITLKIAIKCVSNVDELIIGYIIKDRLGQAIFGTNTFHHDLKYANLVSGQNLDFCFLFEANIGPGTYSVAVAAHSEKTHLLNNYEWRDHALIFNVTNVNKNEFIGLAWIPPLIEVSE